MRFLCVTFTRDKETLCFTQIYQHLWPPATGSTLILMCCHAISIKSVERQHECHPSHRPSRFCFLDVFKLVSNYMKKMLPKLSFFIIANGASLTFVHERGSRRMWRTQKTFCLVHLFTNMKICLADLFTKSFK